MSFKPGGCVFLKFPFRYCARTAHANKPFVSHPACGTTVPGIARHECLVAMSGDSCLVPDLFNGLYAVKNACSGRPEFDLLNQAEKLHPFPVVSLSRFFQLFFTAHEAQSLDLIPADDRPLRPLIP